MSFDSLRKHLAERRKLIGRTQVDVAAVMGTTQSAVSDLESGRTKDPGLDTLARWARALDMSLAVQLSEANVITVPIAPRFDEADAA